MLKAAKARTTSVNNINNIRLDFKIGQKSSNNVEKVFFGRLSWGYCNNDVV